MNPEKLNMNGTSKEASLKPAPSGRPYQGFAPRIISALICPCFISAIRLCQSLKVAASGAVETSLREGLGLNMMPPGFPIFPTRWFSEYMAIRLKRPFVCAPAEPPPMAMLAPLSANSFAILRILTAEMPTLSAMVSGMNGSSLLASPPVSTSAALASPSPSEIMTCAMLIARMPSKPGLM